MDKVIYKTVRFIMEQDGFYVYYVDVSSTDECDTVDFFLGRYGSPVKLFLFEVPKEHFPEDSWETFLQSNRDALLGSIDDYVRIYG